MKSRLLFKIFLASLIILFTAGGLGYISVSRLKRNAKAIVEDTLPGLTYAGAANAYVADASRTLFLIVIDDPKHQTEIHDEIETLSQRTTGYLDEYRKTIYSEDDRANYDALMSERQAYIKVRNAVINLAIAGKKQEALALYESSLMPAHKRVKQAADKIFEYNMQEGKQRGEEIMSICAVTQIGVGILCVLTFLIGFFIGLFK
jgi:hypothetical protein